MEKLLVKLYALVLVIIFAMLSFGFGFSNVEREIFMDLNHNVQSIARTENLFDSTMERYRTASNTAKYVYCDYFAGVWYDVSGNFNVAVTSASRMKDRNSGAIYHIHQFSYNHLKEVHDVMSNLMPSYSVFRVATKLRYNQLVVGLSDESYIENIISYLKRQSLWKEALIEFSVGENISRIIDTEYENSYEEFGFEPMIFPTRAIHAGGFIRTKAPIWSTINRGTISAKATCNRTGRRGVLTNEHVVPRGVGASNGADIGASVRAHFGGLADASFIPFSVEGQWQFTSSAIHGNTVIPRTYMADGRNRIVEGLPVEQFGQTTGRTRGILLSYRASFIDPDTGIRFQEQIWHSANSAPGDSGGPLFTVDSYGRHIMLGIHSHEEHASHIFNVMEVLDVTIASAGIIHKNIERIGSWDQPNFASNSNTHGVVSASGQHQNEAPWRAFNGTTNGGSGGNGDNWSVRATNGWLQLRLHSYVMVHQIEFFNGVSGASNRTRDARFTGRGGVPLGQSFTAPNRDFARVVVEINNVITNVIQLNISSSYGNYVNASMIIIHASIIDQPNFESWEQPRWSSNTLTGHGTVSASGTYRNETPWRAFNGTMTGGSAGSGDNWSVNARTGWLELRLDYPIFIISIELWGNTSGGANRTRGANFTGAGGIALGSSFELANQNQAYQHVHVGGVWTNIIRLNITSSYGNWVGASKIAIQALV